MLPRCLHPLRCRSATAFVFLAIVLGATNGCASTGVAADPIGSVNHAPADASVTGAVASMDPSEPANVPTTPDTGVAVAPADSADASAVTGSQTPTDAEYDFEALYGNAYNPVADPNLPPSAEMPRTYDPWERYNRAMHVINNAVDRSIARPLARFYVAVAPRPVRLGVSNFFSNLGQPVTAVNALLQGRPEQAGQALGRFVLNTTLGIGGVFDPASDAQLDRPSEDFGQTLGVWGWANSRYVELPLFGPRTVRDVIGMVGDAPLSPLRQVEADKLRIPLQGLQLVDVRTQLLSTDSLREGVVDDYALVRDAWLQRRNFQIHGDRMNEDADASLPDYLRDDDNPLVPASAMPVMPTDN